MTLWPQVQRERYQLFCVGTVICNVGSGSCWTSLTKIIQNKFVYLNLWVHKFSEKPWCFVQWKSSNVPFGVCHEHSQIRYIMCIRKLKTFPLLTSESTLLTSWLCYFQHSFTVHSTCYFDYSEALHEVESFVELSSLFYFSFSLCVTHFGGRDSRSIWSSDVCLLWKISTTYIQLCMFMKR